jgi:membrane protein implicated in regulation of membrane protease activity
MGERTKIFIKFLVSVFPIALLTHVLSPFLIGLITYMAPELFPWLKPTIPLIVFLLILTVFLVFIHRFSEWHKHSEDENILKSSIILGRYSISAIQSDIGQRLNLLLDDQNFRLALTCVKQPEKVNSVQRSNNSTTTTTRLLEIFNRKDVYGRFLILGQPGAGKTITLLTLAQELAEIAERDPKSPVPVFIELADWKPEEEFEAWLNSKINVYRISAELLDSGQVIPLLDGLDELGPERLDKAIESINKYLSEKKTRRMVICCRLEEYDQSKEKLDQLNTAVCLQPLNDIQIRGYLNRNHPGLWETIQQKSNLRELLELDGDNPGILRRPFFLKIVPLVLEKNSDIQNQQELIEAYIDRQLDPEVIKAERRLASQGRSKSTQKIEEKLTKEKTIKYLNFLASQLNQGYKIDFSLRDLSPQWLEENEKGVYDLYHNLFSFLMLYWLFIGRLFILSSIFFTIIIAIFGLNIYFLKRRKYNYYWCFLVAVFASFCIFWRSWALLIVLPVLAFIWAYPVLTQAENDASGRSVWSELHPRKIIFFEETDFEELNSNNFISNLIWKTPIVVFLLFGVLLSFFFAYCIFRVYLSYNLQWIIFYLASLPNADFFPCFIGTHRQHP